MRRAALLLLAALSLATAHAQPTPPTTVPTTTATEPPRSAVEPGPETPRGAMARFLTDCREGRYPRAAEYLNARQVSIGKRATLGSELARELCAVLERTILIDLGKLSDQPEGDPNDGLPPSTDSLGAIETSSGTVELLIERVRQAGSSPIWKIASNTVAIIPVLYDEFGWGPLSKVLPAPFFDIRFLQIRLWQWIGFVIVAILAWLAAWIFRHVVVRIAGFILARRKATVDVSIAEHAAGPLRLLLGLIVFSAGTRLLGLGLQVDRVVVGAEKAVAIVAMTWLLMRVLDMVSTHFERVVDRDRHQAITTIPLVRRTIKLFVGTVASVAALQNFGFNVTGIIAGLGLGGLAVALAAQKTVENLFGSVSLIADQPVRVGDVCRFNDTVGTVEDIGLRSTRVRTLDRTVVTVPNSQFSNMALENLSRRDRIPVRATITLPPGTSADSVRKVLHALRETLAKHPKVDVNSIRTRFTKMDPKALEIELSAYVRTVRWDEFVEAREQILLSALDMVTASGVALK